MTSSSRKRRNEDREHLDGVINIASPNPIPYAEFMRHLREAWGMPVGLPATEWMLEIGAFILRTETELILKSRRVIPGRLTEDGFNFEYPAWPEAAQDLCSEWRARYEPKIQINEHIVQSNIENLKLEQNLVLGIIGGSFGGLIGAALWAAITYFSEYQVGWIALGVGFLVGYGVRKLGRGIDKVFGIAGGTIAFTSVGLGNFFASLGFLAKALEMGYIEILSGFNYALTFEFLKETFSVTDILFYIIAIYMGYKYSFRRFTREQLLEGAVIQKDKRPFN
jgi:hypothetical protein